MRIVIVSVGSRGDVQPYVALGVGLRSAGHAVAPASYPHFERFVTRHGIGFRPVANVFDDLSHTQAWAAWQRSGNRPARFAYYLGRLLQEERACFMRLFDDVARACDDADAIVYPTAGLGGPDIAEKRRIPGYWAHLYPAGRSAEFPCFAGPTWLRLGRAYNRLTHAVASRVYRRLVGAAAASVPCSFRSHATGRTGSTSRVTGSCRPPHPTGSRPRRSPRFWLQAARRSTSARAAFTTIAPFSGSS